MSDLSINVAFFGHVDSGKSTTIGRLLFDTQSVKLKQKSGRIGQKINYAWIMDELEEERERGITMDAAIRTIKTSDNITLNIIDTPGHMDYLPNLIKGLCQADVAVYIVDSSVGSFEATLGQNKTSLSNPKNFKPYILSTSTLSTHIMLAKSFGVANIVILLNKMDMIDYNKERYDEITATLQQCLTKYQYKEQSYEIIPISAVEGVNIIDSNCSTNILSTWYKGKTLMETLKHYHKIIVQTKIIDEHWNNKTLYISIVDFYVEKSNYVTISAKIIQGILYASSKLLLSPSNQVVTVKEIFRNNAESTAIEAYANDIVTLNVINCDIDQMRRGDVLKIAEDHNPINTVKIQCSIITTDIIKPMTLGMHMELHGYNISTNIAITKLLQETLKSGPVENPLFIRANTFAKVEITFEKPCCILPFTVCKSLGRICLMSNCGIIAVGVVDKIL